MFLWVVTNTTPQRRNRLFHSKKAYHGALPYFFDASQDLPPTIDH